MEFDVNRFDEYREDNRLEAKKAKDSLPQNLWDTYSAMANCYGGMILLGVTENSDGSFSATGISDAVKLKKDFWNTVKTITARKQKSKPCCGIRLRKPLT